MSPSRVSLLTALQLVRRPAAFTLMETLVSLAVLVITGVGSVSGFMLLNRFASDNRDRSTARALCQERIEQVMTMPFRPKQAVFPSVSSQDGKSNYNLLGKAGDYDTSNANYTGTANQATSGTIGEAVVIYKQSNGTALVTGTRSTTVANGGTVGLVRFTVTVDYTIRGKPATYSLYTLRTAD